MSKAMNILVYCSKNALKFERISKTLRSAIGQSSYTVYQLDESEPWTKYCCLCVIATFPNDVPHRTLTQIRQFARSGGNVLSIGGYFSSLLPLSAYQEPPGPCLDELCYEAGKDSMGQGNGRNILLIPPVTESNQRTLENALEHFGISCNDQNMVVYTPLHVYGRSPQVLNWYFDQLKTAGCSQKDGNLVFSLLDLDLPVLKSEVNSISDFLNHTSPDLPQLFIHSETVTSTQDLLWGSPTLTKPLKSLGMLADVQVSGRGRGKNQWISPKGSMCYSLFFTLPSNCVLAGKLPFLQYLVALATVNAIDKLLNKPLNIRIKWPNDIYTVDGIKIGGVLVNCSSQGSDISLCVGIGLNVNNSNPTLSLSSLSGVTGISTAALAGKITSEFAEEISQFNSHGHPQFVARFRERWLHQDKIVSVCVGNVNCTARITSIDDNGYLSVVDVNSGKEFSVQPDGNSFDMMENLIAVKSSV